MIIGLSVLMILVIATVTTITLLKKPSADPRSSGQGKQTEASLDNEGNLVIPVAGISATATFYPVTVEGTKLEVLAVKAPDGTIRTAFNTCQVCYDSGQGYYKQSGNVLVCQNCGNRFRMDQVEVAKGGCNPVPIFSDNKTVDETNITINGDYLKQAVQIFQTWKTA